MQKKKQESNHREYYSKAQFWDQRYVQNGGFFDWYAQFPELKYSFQTQYNMSKSDSILMIGCGNSKLSQQMFDEGYKNIINIDISPSVIQQMKKVSPDMQWLVMDATNMQQFQNHKFDFVIDKGTMDALIAGRDLTPAVDLLVECMRVTKQQGQLILITYGSPEGRKKVFQQALPFTIFDYYFAYVNLNDMSTMINLMRNNLVGQNGQKVQKQIALQRSMKQFLLIKLLRQRRSKDKQLVVWQNYIKKIQQKLQILDQNQQIIQQKKLNIAENDQNGKQKPAQIQKQQNENVQQVQKQTKPKFSFSSKNQKQSYVYAYSIKRKLGYDFDPSSTNKFQIKDQYKGYEKTKNLQIKGPSSLIKRNLAKVVAYCQQKIISYPNIFFKSHDECFSQDQNSFKVNIKNGQILKIRILRKTNIDITVKYDKMKQIDIYLNQFTKQLVQNLGLKLHPCPKTYSLFTVLKSRMKAKNTNQLLNRFWYPTYKVTDIDLQSKTAQIILSLPPILTENMQEIKKQVQRFTQSQNHIKLQINKIRNGFISFPELQLFGILNMASLSYNKGSSLAVQMQDFWTCEQSLPQEQNQQLSKLFNVQHSMIQTPMSLVNQVMLHLLILL